MALLNYTELKIGGPLQNLYSKGETQASVACFFKKTPGKYFTKEEGKRVKDAEVRIVLSKCTTVVLNSMSSFPLKMAGDIRDIASYRSSRDNNYCSAYRNIPTECNVARDY